MSKLNIPWSRRDPAVSGTLEARGRKLRGAHSGALAAVLAVGVGGFLLVDPGAKDRAWASLPRPTSVQRPAVLQINPQAAIERGIQPSALGAAAPFQFAGVDQTSRERAEKCLAEAIYYEAGSESVEGQQAVAQVVLNRVRHGAFPDSVCGVVYQGSERTTGCQFTFTCDGSLARVPSRSGWHRALQVAREALAGQVYQPIGHATHYHATWVLPYWASSVAMVGRIGGHIFYSWKGAAGSARAFSQAYSGIELTKERLMTQPAEPVLAEAQVIHENPALAGPVKGVDALEDPRNADLLNYKAAGASRGSVHADDMQLALAIESAL